MSIFTGHTSEHAPHSEDAHGSVGVAGDPAQLRGRIAPIGPG